MVSNFLSALILVLFFYGRSLHRKDSLRHRRLMLTVIALDLGLVAYLALFREVLGEIHLGMRSALMIHLFFAITTVLLYFYMIYIGIRLGRGEESYRKKMQRGDRVVVFFRVMTLVTSVAMSL